MDIYGSNWWIVGVESFQNDACCELIHRHRRNDINQTYLLFEGLDTLCTIELCGQHVADTDNQFRQYYFDVSEILRNCNGEPNLTLNFGSAPNYVDEVAAEPGQESESLVDTF